MALDMSILVIINLGVQLMLVIMVSIAVYLAKRRQLKNHCTLMMVTVLLQIIAIVGVMLPSMLGYVRYGQPGSFFNIEIWIHHILGLAVIALWIYINLVFRQVIKIRHSLIIPMRLAFILWLLVLVMGLHLYALIWV
jgi:putative effector of murein hydrolase